MAVYTVHEPLPWKGEAAADPERFAFVRDGFYFWAFLLGPVWMLWRRLWLVTVLYIAFTTLLQLGLWAIEASESVRFIVWFLVALLVGFEAGTLRRWTLTRRGWTNAGVVVSEDVESAERRFFASWTPAAAPLYPTAAAGAATARPGRGTDSQIVGLFPQPGAQR